MAEGGLERLTLALPEQAVFLRDWFPGECQTAAAGLRPAWYRPGWYAGASAWLQERLDQAGMGQAEGLEQMRSCQRGAILRASTPAGRVYLKAVPAMFAHEIPVTVALADRYPEHLPRVIAVDEERRWLLMRDAGEQDLADAWQSPLPEESVRWYARLQIEQSPYITRWLEMGCADHRLDRLADGIEPLLSDAAALQPDDSPVSLSLDEIGRLRALAPALKALCAELAASRVPYSIEHGDLWTQQILVQGGRFTFIDWSDTSISHPFSSLAHFFTEEAEVAFGLSHRGVQDADAGVLCARVRDAYLEPWTLFEPMDRLRHLLELARRLVGLHVALLYHQRILPGMEQRWEMHRMLPHSLRRALRCMEAAPAGGDG